MTTKASRWRWRVACLLTALVGAACRTTQPEPAGSNWRLPAGWKSETFPFPLEFAPDIPLHGVEVLRFPPGFFEPGKPDYWSYDFVWLVDSPAPPDRAQLEDWLTRYFSGLCREVGAKKWTFQPQRFAAHLDDGGRGTVETYDPFATGAELTLQVKVEARSCEGGARRALVFRLSPQSDDAPVWKDLDALAGEYHCSG